MTKTLKFRNILVQKKKVTQGYGCNNQKRREKIISPFILAYINLISLLFVDKF